VEACLELADSVAAVAVDLPGHGDSAGPRGHVESFDTYDAAVGAAIAFAAREFQDASIALFGTSMGGLLALRAAARATSSSLAAVVASAPMLRLPVSPATTALLRAGGWLAPSVSVTVDPAAEAPRHGVCTLGWLRAAAAACDELAATEPGPPDGFPLGAPEAVRVKVPTTLLVGTRDPIVAVAEVRAVGDRLGCESVLAYDGSGHEPFALDKRGRPDKNRERYFDDIQGVLVAVLERRGLSVTPAPPVG